MWVIVVVDTYLLTQFADPVIRHFGSRYGRYRENGTVVYSHQRPDRVPYGVRVGAVWKCSLLLSHMAWTTIRIALCD